MNAMNFLNKVVFISGASSGIGATTAIEYVKKGANVIILGRNEAKMKRVLALCESHGKKPLVIKADVSKDDEVKAAVQRAMDTYRKLDILVNNAGIIRQGSIVDGKLLESYDEVINTNLRAVLYLTSLAAPHLIETKGNIVNISSIIGSVVPVSPIFTAYSLSKAGLNHFTRCAASELSPYGVRVNGVSPGPVATDIYDNVKLRDILDVAAEMTPLKRVSDPIEIADLILFLSSENAKGITGSIFVSDNGFSVSKNPFGTDTFYVAPSPLTEQSRQASVLAEQLQAPIRRTIPRYLTQSECGRS